MPPKVPESLFAEVAPLPVGMADHLLLRLERKTHASGSTLLDLLLKEIQEKRETAFFYMDPFVQAKTLSTAWLLETLSLHSPSRKRVPRPTLSYWASRRHLLRFEGQGKPEPSSAAALFIARMIDDGERNFLPEMIAEDESHWWCTAQVSPRDLPIQVAVTQMNELPPTSLVWTPWSGAVWYPNWVKIRDAHGNDRGAIRWAGGRISGNHRSIWDVSLESIVEWDTTLAPLAYPMTSEVVQLLATLALHHLGVSRTSPSSFSGHFQV